MNTVPTQKREKFDLNNHPWLAYFSLSFLLVLLIITIASTWLSLGLEFNLFYLAVVNPGIPHVITLLIIAPLFMRIPQGNKSYKAFLDEIRLTKLKPFIPLAFLGLSCAFIVLISLGITSIVFRIYQGYALTPGFFKTYFKLQNGLTVFGMLTTIVVIFEEISCRGIFLRLFHKKYTERQTIIITALTFGLFHAINFLNGGDPWFVVRQIIMGCILGIFYGYMVFRVDSLLPAMIFHYVVNILIGVFNGYQQRFGTPVEQTVFLTINLVAVLPILLIWVRWYSRKWLKSDTQQADQV